MAQREELTLDVKVKGAREVDKLTESLEDVESASEQARKALIKVAQTADAELRDAASAAEALGRALGPEMAGKMDVNQITADLNKMGVSFDEIRAEADQFATTLKQLDDIKLSQTSAGLDTMRTKLDNVRSSSDQSRSVLANLAGNAAQDLGELGGVVGSLGVGIGQMAEYAVDGNIALSNLAKVAGPMAGLSAALILVQHYMSGIAKAKAFNKQEAEDYAEAIREIGEGAGTVLDHLEDAGKIEFAADSGLLGFGTTIKDVTGLLDKYGISASEVARVIAGTEQEQTAWFEALAASGVEVNDLAKIMAAVKSQIDGYNSGLERADQVTDVFASTTGDANTALAELNETQGLVTDAWASVLDDMQRNGQVTDASINSWNQLRTELGLTEAQMAELAEQKLDEKLEADAAALEEAAAAAAEYAQAVADLQEAIDSIDADDMSNIAGALGEALDVGGIAVNLQVEEAEVRGQVDEAADQIQEFVDEHGAVDWSVVLDPTKSAAGFDAALAGMIGGLQDSVQTGVVNAFQSGGVPAAEAFVNEFIPQLTALGMSEAQAREFMGIPADGNIPLFLQLQINKEAKADALAILNSIAGVDPNNPAIAYLQLQVQTGAIDPVIAEIAALLLAQKYGVEVRPELGQFTPEQIAAAEAALAANPVTIPTEADTTGAEDGIADVENADHETTIDADADTQEAARQLLDETTRQRQATIYAIAAITSAKLALDSLKERRDASILAVAYTAGAEYELNQTARNRDSYIYQHVVPTGGGGGGGGGATPGGLAAPLAAPMAVGVAPLAVGEEDVGVAPLAAPAMSSVSASGVAIVSPAPTSTVNNLQVTVQAAVIGNRHEVERTVAKALRSYVRLNGSRN